MVDADHFDRGVGKSPWDEVPRFGSVQIEVGSQDLARYLEGQQIVRRMPGFTLDCLDASHGSSRRYAARALLDALRGWAHAAIRPPGHQRTSPTPCWARSRVVQRQHRGMGDLGRNIDLAQEALRAEYLRQLRPHDFERIARARTRAARGLKW